uniref:SERTA domain-containing protein n=1 Tax=Canis lupus familiaris TaxID=9615 RepID=A0A8C0MFM9_CANLF
MGTMFARGLKRKSAEDGEDVEGGLAGTQATPSYSLQRQSLLDMSLVKLQLCHMLVEPNLCRSVLIANTVRQIQEEMTQDGTWRVLAPQAAGRAPLDRLVSTEILCRSVREQEGERPAADVGDGRTPGLVPGLSAVPSAQALRSPQSSLWEVDSSRENRGGFQKSLDQIFETLESKTPGSVEELFSDVDSSYYDLDAVLTGMVGSTQSGPRQWAPGLHRCGHPASRLQLQVGSGRAGPRGGDPGGDLRGPLCPDGTLHGWVRKASRVAGSARCRASASSAPGLSVMRRTFQNNI